MSSKSRWTSELCRVGECGHLQHPKRTPEQAQLLSHVRGLQRTGWRNGARVGNLPRT